MYIPQADNLERVMEVVRIARDDTVNAHDIAERFGFSDRTAWYHIAAAEALGFVQKLKKGADITVTPLGHAALFDAKVLHDAVVSLPAIRTAQEAIREAGSLSGMDDVFLIRDTLRKEASGMSRASLHRRAFSIRSWLKSIGEL